MSYSGKLKYFQLANIAFNHTRDPDSASDETIVHGSKNLYLGRGGISVRGGTQKLYTTAFTSAPDIVGLGYVINYAGTQTILAATGDGKIFKNDTDTVKTGLTADKITNMTVAKDDLFICNGYDQPEVYAQGDANTHTIANPATDWGANSRPKIMINHSLGASTRLVVPGVADYPYTVYISKQGDLEEFRSASGGRLVTLWTKHPKGLTGGVSFGGRCFLFDQENAYYLDDSNADDTTWGHNVAQWNGGLAHERLVCKTPNNIYCMAIDGVIYSVQTAESYGDYRMGQITEEQYMHEWIKEYIDLTSINDFHCVYDPDIKALRFFMQRKLTVTANQNDVCLVYYINKPVGQRWMIEDNKDYVSGYDANCSAIVYDASTGIDKVYTGDYSGFIWTMNDADTNDADNGYYSGFKLRYNFFGNPRSKKAFRSGHIVGETIGGTPLTIRTYIDGKRLADEIVVLTGNAQFGSSTFGNAQFGSAKLVKYPYQIRDKGFYLQTEVFNSGADEDFRLSSLIIDYKELGSIPGY